MVTATKGCAALDDIGNLVESSDWKEVFGTVKPLCSAHMMSIRKSSTPNTPLPQRQPTALCAISCACFCSCYDISHRGL
jgi:hypothetical protein